ncbi:beta-glucosidase [Mumia sp. zg.B17]|uniref:GH1 family beta-glucosidase n=1 Tax=unclassified Mumia TaxID=2621872 RepID=UPI001C6EB707|nr:MULTISPECIES: GH1 family beta-glucosidase [unclassified Mumia]MBW9207915.1 beta-glucosidase [Mumia sp. zg.B17]MDD9348389.1 GH1 family beta-glucosidase [Mumia sp.]
MTDLVTEPLTTLATAFPPDFTFGAATAAYQIEGAVTEDGRTPSIWDVFSAEPGRVHNGDTGEVACDHYHRMPSDVAMMRDLGLRAYRFSIAWPRVQPGGRGPVNARGLAFYDRLVDTLLENGIPPWATLYHWDLPVELEQAGGWPARETAYRFAEYAGLVADALGDRLSGLITMNEPWCSAFLGYGSGVHAPGRRDGAAALAASHHLLLGHGLAAESVRAAAPAVPFGITLNLYPTSPGVPPTYDGPDRAAYDDAVRRIDGISNRWFLDPVFGRGYPSDVVEDVRSTSALEFVRDGDTDIIAAPIDFLGINYYTRHVVAPGAYPGSAGVEFLSRGFPVTAMGWEVDPDGLYDVIRRVHDDYPAVPIVVTENGSAYEDVMGADGAVHDEARLAYLRDHLGAIARLIADGVDLRGYFAWSLMDNFEWAFGYDKRFGLVHVDYATQQRTPKASARWYADLLATHRNGTELPNGILGP